MAKRNDLCVVCELRRRMQQGNVYPGNILCRRCYLSYERFVGLFATPLKCILWTRMRMRRVGVRRDKPRQKP